MTYPPPPQDGWPGQAPQPDPYAQGDPSQQVPPPGPEFQQPGYPPAPTAPMSGVPASGQPFYGQPGYPQQPYPDPYQAGQPMSGVPASGQPWPGVQMPPPPQSGFSGGKLALVIGAVVVVVALVAGGIWFLTSKDDKAPVADPSESASPSGEPSASGDAPSLDPDAPVLTDPGTGFSYAEIGSPWQPPSSTFSMPGFKSVTGEVLATETFEGGASWIATFCVGEIDVRSIGFDGPDSINSAVENLAELTDDNNYHRPPDWTENLKGLERDSEPTVEEITIGKYTGVVYSYHLTWDDDAIKETGESIALGILDLGDGRAAGFTMSLPDSVAEEQQAAFETAIASFHFV